MLSVNQLAHDALSAFGAHHEMEWSSAAYPSDRQVLTLHGCSEPKGKCGDLQLKCSEHADRCESANKVGHRGVRGTENNTQCAQRSTEHKGRATEQTCESCSESRMTGGR